MIVVLGLLLNVATIILGCIFSVLFSDFRVCCLISMPVPSFAVLVFFHANAEPNVHPLLVSWYLVFSLWRYLCSCMHIMSMLWSIAKGVRSGSWPILFKVLTLNVAIFIVLLHFSNFCFSLSSEADFSNTWAWAPTSAGRTSFSRTKIDVVWTIGVSVSHGNLSMAVFLFSSREATLTDEHSSSPIELFDPGRCPVGFVRPAPV